MLSSSLARHATLPDGPRLAAHVAVAALLRRIAAGGGQGMILARGDADAGAILIVTMARGMVTGALERRLSTDGYVLGATGPADPALLDAWIGRRRRDDPDMWVVELEGDRDLPARVAADVLG